LKRKTRHPTDDEQFIDARNRDRRDLAFAGVLAALALFFATEEFGEFDFFHEIFSM
jgi:hypothetical protein